MMSSKQKEYNHLDWLKLGKDKDYWECVVYEHNLILPVGGWKGSWEWEKVKKWEYPQGQKAYNRFCRYFPKPSKTQ